MGCAKERFCNDSDSDMDSIRKLVLYSFVFLWGGGCVCAAQEMFSTKRGFGPVRFSQEQLLELVDRLRVFAKQQGSSPAESDDASQALSFSRRAVVYAAEAFTDRNQATANLPASIRMTSTVG